MIARWRPVLLAAALGALLGAAIVVLVAVFAGPTVDPGDPPAVDVTSSYIAP